MQAGRWGDAQNKKTKSNKAKKTKSQKADKKDEDELFASDSDREDGGTHPKMKAATNTGEEEADVEISITAAQKRFIDQKLNQFRTTKKAPLRSEPPDPLQQVLCREVTPGAK